VDALGWIAGGGPAAPSPAAAEVREVLWRAGFLEPADRPETPDRATWEFHDRLFHVATRGGRDGAVLGGTYRFKDRFPSPPAVKPPMSSDPVALPRPDPAAIAAASHPLAAVMDRRRSGRDYGETPISLGQLAEFLFRVARILAVERAGPQELMSRPFPSGGAIHETEFYVAVRACHGLEPAIYHYAGLDHALERLPGTADAAARLAADAAFAMGQPEKPPHVLIVLTSRLPRFAWKYEGIAYRLTLLNVGVIVQTMYLVATDMGLAACATGTGDSRLFATATGLDPLAEPSVMELALGQPAGPAPP
jgi:SagB-type dehydrogenase family enzyme